MSADLGHAATASGTVMYRPGHGAFACVLIQGPGGQIFTLSPESSAQFRDLLQRAETAAVEAKARYDENPELYSAPAAGKA